LRGEYLDMGVLVMKGEGQKKLFHSKSIV